MTREEAKMLLPIIQAYAEGKTVQSFNNVDYEWDDLFDPMFGGDPSLYRIKPEPEYRPFKDIEECWNEMLKHQPFGWIKAKDSGSPMLIGNIYLNIDEEVYIVWAYNGSVYSASDAFYNYTFADSTPFGIKED